MAIAELARPIGREVADSLEEAAKKERLARFPVKFGICRPKHALTAEEIERIAKEKGATTEHGKPLTAIAIRQRIGVEKIYVASETETPFALGLTAAEDALLQTEVKVDRIIFCTTHPEGIDYSRELARELERKHPGRINPSLFEDDTSCLNVHAACSSVGLGLDYIREHKEEFEGKNVLIVTGEDYSHYLHELGAISDNGTPADPSFGKAIFSAGGTAMLMPEYEKKGLSILDTLVYKFSKENAKDCIEIPFDKTLLRGFCLIYDTPQPKSKKFQQKHKDVYELMRQHIPRLVKKILGRTRLRRILHKTKLEPSAIKAVFPHTATRHILEIIAQFLPEYKVYGDCSEGNWSSGSVPKSFMTAVENGDVKEGDIVVFAPFGAGPLAALAVMRLGGKNEKKERRHKLHLPHHLPHKVPHKGDIFAPKPPRHLIG